MRREAGEIAWRIKLTVAAAFVGGWLGLWGWIYWLASGSYDTTGWSLISWLRWAFALLRTEYASELFIAAAIGAGVFVAPFCYLFFRKG